MTQSETPVNRRGSSSAAARVPESLRDTLAGKRMGLAEEASRRANSPAIRAAEEAQMSKAFRQFSEITNPMAKFERIMKPMAILERNSDMLKMAMDVNIEAKRVIDPSLTRNLSFGPGRLDVAPALPVSLKKTLQISTKTILGQTALDSLKVKPGSLGWSSQSFRLDPTSRLSKTLLAINKAMLPDLPKAVFGPSLHESYPNAFAAAAPLGALDLSPALLGFPKIAHGTELFGELTPAFVSATTPGMLGLVPAMDPKLHARVQAMGQSGVASAIEAAMRANEPWKSGIAATAFGRIDTRQIMDQIGPFSAFERNRRIIEGAFALSEKWDRDSFAGLAAGLPTYDLPFEDDLWTPSRAWKDFENYVDWVLRNTAELSDPIIADLLSKYLYVSAVKENVGLLHLLYYLAWVVSALPGAALTLSANARNPWLFGLFYMLSALKPVEEPKPED